MIVKATLVDPFFDRALFCGAHFEVFADFFEKTKLALFQKEIHSTVPGLWYQTGPAVSLFAAVVAVAATAALSAAIISRISFL